MGELIIYTTIAAHKPQPTHEKHENMILTCWDEVYLQANDLIYWSRSCIISTDRRFTLYLKNNLGQMWLMVCVHWLRCGPTVATDRCVSWVCVCVSAYSRDSLHGSPLPACDIGAAFVHFCACCLLYTKIKSPKTKVWVLVRTYWMNRIVNDLGICVSAHASASPFVPLAVIIITPRQMLFMFHRL